jgi:flagellar biosynthesis/type III secretory pathway M-ring protein FliF/YscJ
MEEGFEILIFGGIVIGASAVEIGVGFHSIGARGISLELRLVMGKGLWLGMGSLVALGNEEEEEEEEGKEEEKGCRDEEEEEAEKGEGRKEEEEEGNGREKEEGEGDKEGRSTTSESGL